VDKDRDRGISLCRYTQNVLFSEIEYFWTKCSNYSYKLVNVIFNLNDGLSRRREQLFSAFPAAEADSFLHAVYLVWHSSESSPV